MRFARPALMTLGAVAALFGLLFIGQGLGYVHWPASSAMLDQRIWADRGTVIAVAGLLAILLARRLPR